MKNIFIQPNGGLCNRLRFICSYLKELMETKKYENTNIYIVWVVNEACNGKLEDYIQPLQNVYFIKKKENLNIDIFSSSIVKSQINKNFLQNIPLKLNDSIYKKIKFIINKLENNYISLHIRKTDLEYYMIKNRNQKIMYNDFIKYIKENKGKKVYLATDNEETQKKFKKKFKNRVYVFKDIESSTKLRQTNLEHTIIDLFICGLSNKFMGTKKSSFSCFIKLIFNLFIKKNPLKNLKTFH